VAALVRNVRGAVPTEDPGSAHTMKLNVRQAASALAVPESQVYRWVEAGEIPCSLMNHQPFFSRAELLEWATARRLPVSVELFENGDEESGARPPRLAEALARGGVHHGIQGGDRPSILRAIVDRLPVADPGDRDVLLAVLLAREALGSTGIGEGIAIPHVRSPLVFPGSPAAVSLCFLETAVPFGAIDGQPVHTIFALVSSTIPGHLQLLSRLSLALHDPGFKAAVLRRAGQDEIVGEARRVDATLAEKHGERETPEARSQR
jgi:PTS system nitrogen regulatory IIA component